MLSGWRVSLVTHHQSGSPYSIIYSGDPTGAGAGLNAACNSRGCQNPRPGARNTERGMFINGGSVSLARLFRVGEDRLSSGQTSSTCRTTRTCWRVATSTRWATSDLGSIAVDRNVLPGRQFLPPERSGSSHGRWV